MDNKEKLEEAKRLYETANADQKYVLERIFPELKESEESENERIRKDIVFYIAANHKDDGEKARWLYWLEKQGEQKPVDVRTTGYWHVEDVEQKPAWSEEDEEMLENAISSINHDSVIEGLKSRGISYSIDLSSHLMENLINWLKSLKDRLQPQPKQEWNSGDDAHLHSLITHLEDFIASHPNTTGADIQGENVAWLKSLRPQNTWKPSDEQMKALRIAFEVGTANDSWAMRVLKGLYQSLKKLREG